jgi:uncharacterized membrane protein
MTNSEKRKQSTQKLVFAAILTAMVIVLQYISMALRFGTFSITLTLVPIVIGAATCGVGIGGWLGFVFGVAVLLSGDAATFLAVDVFGTILTVLLKGTAAGLCSGLLYQFVLSWMNQYSNRCVMHMKRDYALGECCEGGVLSYISRNNRYIAVLASAVICPVVNTGVFLLGCQLFFLDTVSGWGAAAGYENVASYMFLVLAGTNFLIEMATNLLLAPVIVRLISIAKK